MPTFTEYGIEVDADIEVSVNEFYEECTDREKKELAEYLIEDGFIPGRTEQVGEDSLMDVTYREALNKLYSKRIYLTLEEEQFIINLANKY